MRNFPRRTPHNARATTSGVRSRQRTSPSRVYLGGMVAVTPHSRKRCFLPLEGRHRDGDFIMPRTRRRRHSASPPPRFRARHRPCSRTCRSARLPTDTTSFPPRPFKCEGPRRPFSRNPVTRLSSERVEGHCRYILEYSAAPMPGACDEHIRRSEVSPALSTRVRRRGD
jgi:hypothetical protein